MKFGRLCIEYGVSLSGRVLTIRWLSRLGALALADDRARLSKPSLDLRKPRELGKNERRERSISELW